MDTSILSPERHFRVHYDTTGANAPSLTDLDHNTIPDYIDSTLAFLEYAWDLEVNALGYHPPKSDNGAGGGDEIDVYIQELGNGNYGITYPDQESNGTSSGYIILDNNYSGNQYYSKGLDGLKVTSAHEFFHVIQFGYLSFDLLSDLVDGAVRHLDGKPGLGWGERLSQLSRGISSAIPSPHRFH